MRLTRNEHQYEPVGMPVNFPDMTVERENHPALDMWQRMRSCIARIDTEINTRMREEYGVTMPQFELLSRLHGFPDGLRMGELSRLMKVSGASVTSITDQLEDNKLVLRTASQIDRRVNSVKLTSLGIRIFEGASTAYEAWVIELMNGLPIRDGEALCDQLDGDMPSGMARSKGVTRGQEHAALT